MLNTSWLDKKAGGEEHRIAGQKETDQQAGFAEDNCGQNGVANPRRSAQVDQRLQILRLRQADQPFDLIDNPLDNCQTLSPAHGCREIPAVTS